MGISIYEIEYQCWRDKSESKLKKEIKHEKVMQRRIALQEVYNELKRDGVYKEMKKDKKVVD